MNRAKPAPAPVAAVVMLRPPGRRQAGGVAARVAALVDRVRADCGQAGAPGLVAAPGAVFEELGAFSLRADPAFLEARARAPEVAAVQPEGGAVPELIQPVRRGPRTHRPDESG